MTITALTLSDPARGLSYVLKPNDAVRVADMEFTATVREVAEDNAGADGSYDTTQWLGAGAVTVTLAAVDTVADVLDAVAQFLVPWSRPYLVVSDDEWSSDRQVRLRFDSQTHPAELPGYRQVQLAWKAPAGLWEDTSQPVYEIAADVPDLTGLTLTGSNGVSITAASGITFPASTTSGSAIVTVAGSARPRWKAKLYGPCTGPKLTRDDTGQTLNFTDGLSIPDGDYVELDSAAKSALMLSQPDSSVLAYLDFAASEWFALDPGSNLLRYHGTTGTTAGSICELVVYPVWMP